MSNKFVILVKGKLETYTQFEDIPGRFENVIEFKPEIQAPPHTKKEHEEIEKWNAKLQELLTKERENARSNKDR